MNVAPGAQNVSISTVCLSGTLEDKLRAAAAAGFAGVEMLEYDLVMSPWSPARLAEEAAALGLSARCFSRFTSRRPRPTCSTPACVTPSGSSACCQSSAPASSCAARREPRGDSTTTISLLSNCTPWQGAPSSADSGSRTKPCHGDEFVRTRMPGASSNTSTTPRWGCVSTASMHDATRLPTRTGPRPIAPSADLRNCL